MSLLIGLVILALFLGRQLTARPLRGDYLLPGILAVIGLLEFGALLMGTQQFVAFLKGQQHHVTIHHGAAIVAAAAGSLILAAATGALRAPTVRVWWQDGQSWRQGTWLTLVLWIASLAAHLGYDALITRGKAESGLGDATLLLYFAVSLTVQRLILMARAARTPRGANSGLA